jgi:hypothetical protein
VGAAERSVVLVLHTDDEGRPAGVVRGPGDAEWPFVGWLDLVLVLDRCLDDPPG